MAARKHHHCGACKDKPLLHVSKERILPGMLSRRVRKLALATETTTFHSLSGRNIKWIARWATTLCCPRQNKQVAAPSAAAPGDHKKTCPDPDLPKSNFSRANPEGCPKDYMSPFGARPSASCAPFFAFWSTAARSARTRRQDPFGHSTKTEAGLTRRTRWGAARRPARAQAFKCDSSLWR